MLYPIYFKKNALETMKFTNNKKPEDVFLCYSDRSSRDSFVNRPRHCLNEWSLEKTYSVPLKQG